MDDINNTIQNILNIKNIHKLIAKQNYWVTQLVRAVFYLWIFSFAIVAFWFSRRRGLRKQRRVWIFNQIISKAVCKNYLNDVLGR